MRFLCVTLCASRTSADPTHSGLQPRIPDFLVACWWAEHGVRVFPQLPNKAPMIRSPHSRGSRERVTCKGACGQDGHGHLDATVDLDRIRSWGRTYGVGWGGVAGRLAEGFIDIEFDPRHGGDTHLRQLQDIHGPLPKTLEIVSGRGDGGRHRIFSVPVGLKLDGHRLRGTGVDLKDHNGAVRLPPSAHHVNFRNYRLVSRPIVPAPGWLLALLLAGRSKRSLSRLLRQQTGNPSPTGFVKQGHGTTC